MTAVVGFVGADELVVAVSELHGGGERGGFSEGDLFGEFKVESCEIFVDLFVFREGRADAEEECAELGVVAGDGPVALAEGVEAVASAE